MGVGKVTRSHMYTGTAPMVKAQTITSCTCVYMGGGGQLGNPSGHCDKCM